MFIVTLSVMFVSSVLTLMALKAVGRLNDWEELQEQHYVAQQQPNG